MSNFQQKNQKAQKETGKYGPFKGKKNKSTETITEKDLMTVVLDKDFKIIL